MEFVRVGRDGLIRQFKEFITLLKKCSRDTQFHACIEFSGIDKDFIRLADKFYEEKMKRQAKEQNRKRVEEGSI